MYKILTFCFLAILLPVLGKSQATNYKAIEWDILRVGFVIPSGEGVKTGFALGSELRYNVTNAISAGLRAEFALFGSASETGAKLGAAGSYALMGDYYFNQESTKRLFAGLGLGLFNGASATITDPDGNDVTADAGSSVGVIPRVGFELGHLRISAEYNLPFKDTVSKYLGIHLAATIGGGAD